MTPAVPQLSFVDHLKREWLLCIALLIAIVLGCVDPQPAKRYVEWMDIPTLAGLFALLAATQAVRRSGYVQYFAWQLTSRVSTTRALALVLVAGAGVSSMVLTNDVSLFLIVPLTVVIGKGLELPASLVRRLVIFEAFAVNAGSMLSPVGNPQNLLVWQLSKVDAWHFVVWLLPAFAVGAVALIALTIVMFPGAPIVSKIESAPSAQRRPALALTAASLLLGTIVLLQLGLAWVAAVVVAGVFLAIDRPTLRSVDWALLATFSALFVGLGHLADWGPVHAVASRFHWSDPATLYAGGTLLSQVISNVPATVFLSQFTESWQVLLIAVNVGGYGLAIGSMANLIALRLEGSKGIWWEFHLYSVPFFIAVALLTWFFALPS